MMELSCKKKLGDIPDIVPHRCSTEFPESSTLNIAPNSGCFSWDFVIFFRTATSQNTHEALSDVCTSSRCSVSLFDAEYVFSCNDDNDNKLFLRNSWMTKNVNP